MFRNPIRKCTQSIKEKVNDVFLYVWFSKHCWVNCLLRSTLNVASVFLSEKYIHLLCLSIGDRERERLQRLLAQSAGVSPMLLTQLCNANLCISGTFKMSVVLACALPIRFAYKMYFLNTFTNVNLKQNFSLPVSKEHLEMINLSLHLAQMSSGRN